MYVTAQEVMPAYREVLDDIKRNRIFSVFRDADGAWLLGEECDEYFVYGIPDPSTAIALSNLFREIADDMGAQKKLSIPPNTPAYP